MLPIIDKNNFISIRYLIIKSKINKQQITIIDGTI